MKEDEVTGVGISE